jgi:hypothetical protein
VRTYRSAVRSDNRNRLPFHSKLGNVALVRTMRIIAFVTFCCSAFVHEAIAAPPENGDPLLGPWFSDLSASDGTPCCSIADCRRTSSRHTADGYEALIDGIWVVVPWDRVLTRTDNPTGQAVVCCAPRTKIILCFVRPPET